jgi:twitching motility protein PilJ
MKNENGLFAGRYWLPVFGFGALILFAASIFGAYLIWQKNTRDAENIQKIDEFKSLSASAQFFSRKMITGDESATASLIATVDGMDRSIEFLLDADEFTRQQLATEYESTVNFWRSIHNNATIISEVSPAIATINTAAAQLDGKAIRSQKLFGEAVVQGVTQEQLVILQSEAALLRQMSSNMDKFIAEEKGESRFFDAYRSAFVEFGEGYNVLLNGDVASNVPALTNEALIAEVNSVKEAFNETRQLDAELLSAAEALMSARVAHVKVNSSLEGLSLTLDEMRIRLGSLSDERFLKPLYIVITLLISVLCVLGFIVTQKQSAREAIEMEQSNNENVQAAILRLLDELADLADGDLTVTTTVSEDFTGAIADSVNYTIDQLRQLVSRINNTAVQVSGAAQDSQQTALHLAEASDHQAQEIAGASAAINEMAVTIDQVSANAAESALVASKSVSIANNGAKLVQNTIHGMDTIREQIQDTSKRIKRLGESSQEIGDIVSLINDIADQTNILALNAAIQASMAGDAGRGFAVVADEVQRLAERSAGATKQIETLVKTIQTDTNEAVTSMEQTTSEVVSGARLAQDAGVALEEIEGVSANIAELIQNISNAARQQASSAGHISNTMNVIQEITSQTSAGTGATAQAIGDLADMALELRESVAGFTLPEDMEETADGMADDAWLSADDMGLADAEAPAADIDLEDIADVADVTEMPLETEMDLDSAIELTEADENYDFDDLGLAEQDIEIEDIDETSELLDGLASMAEDENLASADIDEELDFSEEMFNLADGESIDLLDEEFDLADFDFMDEKEKDSVS